MSMRVHSTRCWIDNAIVDATIEIADSVIQAIYPGAVAPIDMEFGDAVLMPGVVDVHVHVNEPGRTEWEGFETATLAAIKGGTTSIVDMPLNSTPVTTDLSSLAAKIEAAKNKLYCDVGFYAGFTGQGIRDLEDLLRAGCLGVKAFLVHSGIDDFPNVTYQDLDRAMPVIAKYDVPLLVHCELEQDTEAAGVPRDPKSYQDFLRSRPRSWENAAVRMMISLCEKHHCRTHIVHLSSSDVISDISAARSRGAPLTVETCPHYLLFSSEEIPDGQTVFKCAPPIREEANNLKLKEAVRSGVIDFIASDHSPAPPDLKYIAEGDLEKAWGGIAGIQFLLSAAWTGLRNTLSIEQFIPLLTRNPAAFAGLQGRKGVLEVGYDADLVAWSPDDTYLVSPQDIAFRHAVSPYVDRELYGRIDCVIVNGRVASDGQRNGDLLLRMQRLESNLKEEEG